MQLLFDNQQIIDDSSALCSSAPTEMKVVLLFTFLAFVTNAAGIITGCPDDWTQVKRKCYKFVNEDVRRDNASATCGERYGATLATIHNMEENVAVQDLIHGHKYAWIGLDRRNGYHRWDGRYKFQVRFQNWVGWQYQKGKECVQIVQTGYWQPARCNKHISYVCGKIVDCEPGWFGDECECQCHCYLGHDCNDEPCPYGCEPGWNGEMCDTHYRKPKVTFYCMKIRGGGYTLRVFMDRYVQLYQRIGAVNAEGDISPNCTNDRFRRTSVRDIHLNVQIPRVSGVLKPDCPAETVADGILRWTFRLQMKEGIESVEDEVLQVQCDLSEADAAYDSERVVMEENREIPLTTATQTRVNVRTFLANLDSLEPVINFALGAPVRLVVTLPEGDDLVHPFFYPRSCQASSPDGKVSFQMTNSDGCPRNEYEIFLGKMDKASGVIQSDMFKMFRLWGYTDVVFSCTLVVPTLTHAKYQKPSCS
ncbi:uncharacterized protein [Haliotis cracherodii]|uniref:uncharacterized protein n=1 Tax=Haliotis cracherodii TaxID=6455 RepID=UPI0039E7777E